MFYIMLGLAYAVDPVILYHACFQFLKPKYKCKISYVCLILFFYAVTVLKQNELQGNQNQIILGLSFPVMIITVIFFVAVLFQGTIKHKGIMVCSFYVLSLVAEGIVCISFGILGVNSDFILTTNMLNANIQAFSKICQTILYIVIVHFMTKRNEKVKMNTIATVIMYSIILLLFLIITIYYIQDGTPIFMLTTYSIQISVVIIFSLYISNIIHKNENSKIAALKRAELLESKIHLMEDNKKINEELRALRHDMKAHFAMIRSMTEQNKLEELKEYMNECYAWIDTSERVYVGENTVLMTLINEIAARAKENHITFDRTITTEEIPLSDFEQGVVLSNILNNALEANLFTENENRFIRLEIKKAGGDTLILCSNSFFQRIEKKGNKYLTNKMDKVNHGLGIQNVRKIVKKHKGKFEQWNEQTVFYTEIRLIEGGN